jgi:hypothetical protein
VVDYFTPFNQASFIPSDKDLGSGGPLLLPDSVGSVAHPHLLIGAGKEGRIYLIDRDHMGHFDPKVDHVVQEALVLTGAFDTPAYLGGIFYYACHNAPGQAFSILNGAFKTVPISQTPDQFSYPGVTPSISANNQSNRILWTLDRATNQLRAYDALNLAHELYTSAQAPNGRDRLGPPTKFAVPTIANGKVYAGTQKNLLVAYGLLNQPSAQTDSAPTADSTFAKLSTPLAALMAAPRGMDEATSFDGGVAVSALGSPQPSLLTTRHTDAFFSSRVPPRRAPSLGRALGKSLSNNDWLADIF